jgi:periplasmic copper chaperone A
MNTTPSLAQSTLATNARRLLGGLLIAGTCSLAWAQTVSVSNPWARATVPGQTGAGVFMTLSASAGARLLSASSPVAGFGQVHEMRMEGDIMKMQALKDGLELPAGKTVELKPGSYHVMLMDLKTPLRKDSTIPLTLVFIDAKGLESKVELTVPVNSMAQMAHPQPSK